MGRKGCGTNEPNIVNCIYGNKTLASRNFPTPVTTDDAKGIRQYQRQYFC